MKRGDCSSCGLFLEMYSCVLCDECNCMMCSISHDQKHRDNLETTRQALNVVRESKTGLVH